MCISCEHYSFVPNYFIQRLKSLKQRQSAERILLVLNQMYGLIKQGLKGQDNNGFVTDDGSLASKTLTNRHDQLNLTKHLSQGFIGRARPGFRFLIFNAQECFFFLFVFFLLCQFSSFFLPLSALGIPESILYRFRHTTQLTISPGLLLPVSCPLFSAYGTEGRTSQPQK